MPFPKKHKHGAKKILERELDEQPICFKSWKGDREKIKTVPGWQERFREFAQWLISQRNEQDYTDIDR